MNPEQFARLCKSLTTYGLDKPITRWGKFIVFGWQRLRGCTATGVAPRFIAFVPKGKTAAEIDREIRTGLLREDLDRRQLSASQVASAALDLLEVPGADVLELTQKALAASVGVDPETLRQARLVKRKGSGALNKALRNGDVKAYDAANIVDLPKRKQTEAIRIVQAGEAKTVTAARLRVMRDGHIDGCSDKTDVYEGMFLFRERAETPDIFLKTVLKANHGMDVTAVSVAKQGKMQRDFVGFCVGEDCHRGIYRGDEYIKSERGVECRECRPGNR
jgi:hypothetical protein